MKSILDITFWLSVFLLAVLVVVLVGCKSTVPYEPSPHHPETPIWDTLKLFR
jgi:predicted component of type VI protein secretion system